MTTEIQAGQVIWLTGLSGAGKTTLAERLCQYLRQKSAAAVADRSDKNQLAGKIVCIPNADPGYDWLFAYPIAGLITAWGGANSHMAIRAGELGLPAIIGAGERSFRQWSAASCLHIDCAGRRVEIIG